MSGNETYWYAQLTGDDVFEASGTLSDNLWSYSSSCHGNRGQTLCWQLQAPIGVSDGGGVQDAQRKLIVDKAIDKLISAQLPAMYHPITLPEIRDKLFLDPETQSLLEVAFATLNTSNPSLAQDCWLCLKSGPLRATIVPANASLNISRPFGMDTACRLLPPRPGVYLDPRSPLVVCLHSPPPSNNDSTIDVGWFPLPCAGKMSLLMLPSSAHQIVRSSTVGEIQC